MGCAASLNNCGKRAADNNISMINSKESFTRGERDMVQHFAHLRVLPPLEIVRTSQVEGIIKWMYEGKTDMVYCRQNLCTGGTFESQTVSRVASTVRGFREELGNDGVQTKLSLISTEEGHHEYMHLFSCREFTDEADCAGCYTTRTVTYIFVHAVYNFHRPKSKDIGMLPKHTK